MGSSDVVSYRAGKVPAGACCEGGNAGMRMWGQGGDRSDRAAFGNMKQRYRKSGCLPNAAMNSSTHPRLGARRLSHSLHVASSPGDPSVVLERDLISIVPITVPVTPRWLLMSPSWMVAVGVIGPPPLC